MRKPHRSLPLFCRIDTAAFASVMIVVVFMVVLSFMVTPPYHGSSSVDIPTVLHPVSMPGALREDAMLVSVTRDGHIFFGRDEVAYGDLSAKIRGRLQDRGIERKVYIKADMRAYYGNVKQVLEAVREAGVVRVAFITFERKTQTAGLAIQ